MDWNLFQTVDDWSRQSSWAHGFFRTYADYGIWGEVGRMEIALARAGLYSFKGRGDALDKKVSKVIAEIKDYLRQLAR